MPTIDQCFAGKRVLVTQADQLMGPAIVERFENAGATVTGDVEDYAADPDLPARTIEAAGHIDILVVNLRPKTAGMNAAELTGEQEWQLMFDQLVHPTQRFVSAALPQMNARKHGKIIVVSSAIPMKPIDGLSTYCAARGAQNAFVNAVGVETARHNVQVNAVGQNWVLGGYSDDYMADDRNRKRVEREVPARRLAEGWEQAELVLFLASQKSNFMSGQVVPFAGGWVI